MAVFRDVDGDGKADIVYLRGGQVRYAKPYPANPTGKWIAKNVSEKGYGTAFSLGVGDLSGDGRIENAAVFEWWEVGELLSGNVEVLLSSLWPDITAASWVLRPGACTTSTVMARRAWSPH